MQQIRTMSPLKSLKRQVQSPQPKLQFTANIKQLKQQQLDYTGIHQKQFQGLQAQFQRQIQEMNSPPIDLNLSKQSIQLSQLDSLHKSATESQNYQSTDGKDYRMLYKELQEQLDKYLLEIHTYKDKLYDNDTKLQAYSTFMDDLMIAVKLDPKMRQNQHTMLFNPILDCIMDIHKDNTELREQVKKQQTQLDEQEQQFTAYNQKIQDLKDQYHKFRQQIFVAKQQQEKAQRELNSNIILKEDQTLKKQIQVLKQQLDESETKIVHLQEQLEQTLQQVDQMEGLKAENQVLTDKIQDLIGLDNNKQYIEGLVKEISQQQKKLNQQSEQIESLEKQIKLQQKENENAKDQLVIYQQESYKQDAELQRFKHEEQMFMQQLSVSRSNLKLKEEELQEVLSKQNQVVDKVKAKYDKQMQEMVKQCEREKRIEKEEANEVINDLRNDRTTLFKKILSLTHTQQISEMKDMYMKLEDAIQNISTQIDEMSQKQAKQQEAMNINVLEV